MVIRAEKDARRRWHSAGLPEKPAASSPSSRSFPQSRLHNFSFPTLSWGNQRLLRCANVSGRSMDDDLQTSRPCSSSSPNELPPPPLGCSGQKRAADDEMKESNHSVASASKPWNLRSRRSSINGPAEIVWNRNLSSSSSPSPPPSHSPFQEKTSAPLIFLTRMERLEMRKKGERQKFSITLSREEIEEDFLMAKGTKPPRRPKKRAKYLQRQLDALFPGVLLSEVSPDLYKIDEIES